MAEFVHLHLHSEYSLLDGACRVKEIASQAKKLGQSAVAITDHGVMYGVIDFYQACLKTGVKPIIGCEVYVAPRGRRDKVHPIDRSPHHLVLLCKNEVGYRNLIQLVSAGHLEGFYGKPRIDRELLTQKHEGLICLSACLGGEVPRLLLAGDDQAAVETARLYQGLFGEDYYLELQNHGLEKQQRLMPMIAQLAQHLSIPVVATNDAHYLTRDDAKMQAVLICIQTNHVYGEEGTVEFETPEFYMKSADEMQALCSAYPEAVENTVKIADQCNLTLRFGDTKLPRFVVDGSLKTRLPSQGTTADEAFSDHTALLTSLCEAGMYRHYGEQPPQEVRERLAYEISVITQMGFVDYFLIVHDFIRYAKQHKIPVGPGRGSGAGSLAAYCIGITGIDPIKFDLLFERFLNPERISMPDFDIDFCIERRGEVIDYVVQKYGADHVAQIITFGTMAARLAIRDTGRAMGHSYQVVDEIAKKLPTALGMTIDKALEQSPEFAEAYRLDDVAAEIITMARKLEGMPRHASTHAAGVVITPKPTDHYVPLQKNDEVVVTQYPMGTLEQLGLLKMDFLGLRNLTVMDHCIRQIHRTDPDFSLDEIPLDDPAVFEMLARGDTDGVFQLESAGVRRVLKALLPERMEDMIAVLSLYRPGPRESIPRYIQNKHHPEGITYAHPLLEPILSVTYGCLVYQEQVMQICRSLSGYSYGRADLVRRAVSKKKADVMAQERAYFLYGKQREDGSVECVGAVHNGIPEPVATQIFDEMSSFATYAFNKSHAAAYALIAYQTAYLKCHAKSAFMAALLSSVIGTPAKIKEYIACCRSHGIRVLPPEINHSELVFVAKSEDEISFGLLAIKNLGRGSINALLQERKTRGPFADLSDLLRRMQGKEWNKRGVESLIRSGALDAFSHHRRELLSVYEAWMDQIDADQRRNIEGQLTLFGEGAATTQRDQTIPVLEEFPWMTLLTMERETLGLYLSGHPLDEFSALAERLDLVPLKRFVQQEQEGEVSELAGVSDGAMVTLLGVVQSKKEHFTKKKEPMAFLTLEDQDGEVEVVVFARLYRQVQHLLAPGMSVVLSGKASIKPEEKPKVLAEQVVSARYFADQHAKTATSKTLPEAKPEAARTLFVKFSGRSDVRMEAVIQLLSQATPGEDAVVFYLEDTKKYHRKRERVAATSSLIEKLAQILPPDWLVLQ